MSLRNAAQYLAAHGRGADTTLMHVAPDEVARLQRAAQEQGGSLTINPHTGLPEADFFSDLNPVHILKGEGAIGESGLGPALLALGLNAIAPGSSGVAGMLGLEGVMGNAAATGLAIGGAGALATGSLQKGLMAGFGAYGASGLGEAAMNAASPAIGDAAIAKSIGLPSSDVISAGTTAPMSMADTIKAGARGIGGLGTKDLLKYGLAAAGPIAAAQSNKPSSTPTATPEGNIRQYYYDPQTHSVKPLPVMSAKDFGNTTFESRVPYLPQSQAANGGLQAAYANGGMADGGPADDAALSAYQAGDYAGANKALQTAGMTAQGVVDKYGLNAAEAAQVAKNLGYENANLSGLHYGDYTNYTADDINKYIAQNHLDQTGIEAAEKQFNADPAAVLAAQQSGVNKWYKENPNATPQEVADTVKSVGGLNSGLTAALSQHYGLTPEEIRANYKQLTAPAPVPMYEDTGGNGIFSLIKRKLNEINAGGGSGGSSNQGGSSNKDAENLAKMGIGAAASRYIPGFDYASGVGNLFSGNYGAAAKDFISGYTGGLSSIFDFAEGGEVKRFADGGGYTTYTPEQINNYFAQNPVVDIAAAAKQYNVDPNAILAARTSYNASAAANTAPVPTGISSAVPATAAPAATPAPVAPPAYTHYTDTQIGNYLTANPKADLQAALKEFNGDPAELNRYVNSLAKNYIDPTDTTRGSGYLSEYQNAIKQGIDPTEYSTAASAINKGFNTGYWNQDTVSHAYDVAKNIVGAGNTLKADKDWVALMDSNKISIDDVSRATGLTKAEVKARYDAAKTSGATTTPVTSAPAASTPVVSAPVTPGTTKDTYTGGTTTTPKTYAPAGVTNPYGNTINPGDITKNADSTLITHPNVTGRPYGGFTGMGQVRDAYTAGGGNLGQVLTPAKAGYTNTGESADAYKYLSGQGDYPTQETGIGKNSRYYYSAPSTSNATSKYWINPKTGTYELNPGYPGYVDPVAAAKAKAVAATAADEYSAPGGANGGLMAAMARGGSTHQPFFSRSTGKFNYTGAKVYADGGISVGSRYDPRIDGNSQDTPNVPFQTTVGKFASGGEAGYNLGGYSDGGRLLRGPGDGVSDSIPATIGHKQPARLADGEFVVPARIVSELGNGSTEAGARKLYAMMERVQQARGKTVGKGKVAKNSRADKYLPV
jgi:hypothetical protein